MTLEGRHCHRCDKLHGYMEQCPKAPGFRQLWDSYWAKDGKYDNAWWAPAIALWLVFCAAVAFYSIIH